MDQLSDWQKMSADKKWPLTKTRQLTETCQPDKMSTCQLTADKKWQPDKKCPWHKNVSLTCFVSLEATIGLIFVLSPWHFWSAWQVVCQLDVFRHPVIFGCHFLSAWIFLSAWHVHLDHLGPLHHLHWHPRVVCVILEAFQVTHRDHVSSRPRRGRAGQLVC